MFSKSVRRAQLKVVKDDKWLSFHSSDSRDSVRNRSLSPAYDMMIQSFSIHEFLIHWLTLFLLLCSTQHHMPPKKSQNVKDENVLLLGRVGTNLKVGIVGLPNVGWVSWWLEPVVCIRIISALSLVSQEVHFFQCPDQKPSSCWKLPILHHWS